MTIVAPKERKFSFSLLLLFFLVLFICICQTTEAEGTPNHDKKVVCYFASWSTYRKPYPFTPEEIDPSLCTHLVYKYAAIKNDTYDTIVSNSPYTDLKIDSGLGYYSAITSLKNNYPHLRVLLCLDGWYEGSMKLSKMASSDSKRKTFVKSVVVHLREHNFDGLDLLWQYPAQNGASPNDKENMIKLLRELKVEFKNYNYLLSVCTSNVIATLESGYDLQSIGQIVDWINLFGLNFNSPWNKKFGVTSPLHSHDGHNINNLLDYYLNHGIPSSKVVLVLPAIGFGFKDTHKPGQTDGLKGLYDEDKGFHTYNEICRYIIDPKSGWTETWDNFTSTPIAVKGNEKISYDNQNSIKIKVKFAYEKKLAGVGLWTLDADDFLGLCSLPGYGSEGNQSKFPLVKAINQEYDRLIKEEEERLKNLPHKNDTKVGRSGAGCGLLPMKKLGKIKGKKVAYPRYISYEEPALMMTLWLGRKELVRG